MFLVSSFPEIRKSAFEVMLLNGGRETYMCPKDYLEFLLILPVILIV